MSVSIQKGVVMCDTYIFFPLGQRELPLFFGTINIGVVIVIVINLNPVFVVVVQIIDIGIGIALLLF